MTDQCAIRVSDYADYCSRRILPPADRPWVIDEFDVPCETNLPVDREPTYKELVELESRRREACELFARRVRENVRVYFNWMAVGGGVVLEELA